MNKLLENELGCVDLKLTSFLAAPGGGLLLVLAAYAR